MSAAEVLSTELATYERCKNDLLQRGEGKYALIHGELVAGLWDTYEDALNAGYQEFGLQPFLVKQIQRLERIQFISRVTP